MRQYMIGIIVIITFSLFNISITETAFAADHKLEDLNIHVTINENGDAKITETRRATLSEGTENYIVIGNLGDSLIQNFKVTESGREYENIGKWNIDATKEEKAFKNGIISTKNGYELCWGIGDYGEHEYVVEYVITNFIKQLKDDQMLFWKFVNEGTNIPPENVKIEIETNKHLNDNEEKIWAFGFSGDIHFVNGKIIANSTQPLTPSDYVTVLVQFEDELFNTSDFVNQTFAEVQDKAFIGSDYHYEEQPSSPSGITSKIGMIISTISAMFSFLFFGVIIIGIVIIIYLFSPKLTEKKARVFKRKYKGEYYRDFPYKGDHLDTYYIAYIMGLGNFKTLFTSLLLKWIKDGLITVETEDGGFFRKQRATLTILHNGSALNSVEKDLFVLIRNAAGKNGMMNENQLAKWAERNKSKLHKWEKAVMNDSIQKLEQLNYIIPEEKKILFLNKTVYELTNSGFEVETNIYKYVNYLYDYSLLNEHEAINVHIWDEIMVWAGYLGLTTVVMKQFQSLYPHYTEESVYRRDTAIVATTLATRTATGRNTSRSSSSRSGGSGGSASRGGGGGSFGGGRGGGTR